jgi:Mn2+/Fe2+ NRAMP family transporter
LGGMAEATGMVTGLSALLLTPAFAALILALLIWSSYRTIANIFKWLTLVLFAYVATAFLARPDWKAVLEATFTPRLHFSKEYMSVLVAVLGTTISPYLFVWQAAQEVEEHRGESRKKGAVPHGLQTDTIVGMAYSNVIMYFIILATGATLHAHGTTHVDTAKQAAEALLPLAGRAAYILFAVGLIGTGMLGVPVLAGSCGYAFAEAAAWRGRLDASPRRAPYFYAVIVAATVAGLVLNYSGISAVRMMFLSAVINGVLAPPLVLLVILLTSSRRVMGDAVNSWLLRGLGWATFGLMSLAALALLVV